MFRPSEFSLSGQTGVMLASAVLTERLSPSAVFYGFKKINILTSPYLNRPCRSLEQALKDIGLGPEHAGLTASSLGQIENKAGNGFWLAATTIFAVAALALLLGSVAHRGDPNQIDARDIERLRLIAPAAGPTAGP